MKAIKKSKKYMKRNDEEKNAVRKNEGSKKNEDFNPCIKCLYVRVSVSTKWRIK